MNNFKKIFQQTFWQILGKVVTSLSTFIILGLVTRNYGKEGTGIFTLALTYLAIFYLIGDFGFNAHILREIKDSDRPAEIRKEWRKLLGTRILWSLVLVVLAVGLLPFWPFTTLQFSQSVLFGCLAVLGSSVFITCNLIFQGKLRYDLSVLASSFGTLLSLLFFIYLSISHYPIPFLLFAHLLGWILIALASLLLVQRFVVNIAPITDIGYMKSLFKESWPIAATLSLNVLYFRADSFIIAYFKGAGDVGIYNVAYSVFQSVLVLPTFVMNAYYPMMLRSLKAVRLVLLGLFGLAVLGTLTTIILSPLIIKILTGGGFIESTGSLQILSLGFPAYFLSALLMWFLITKDKYKSMLFVYMLGLLINIVLNFIFIPRYSFWAASFTTVISEYLILLMQVIVLWFNKKEVIR